MHSKLYLQPLLTLIWLVSWSWGGSNPSGTAGEVKAGEVTVTSHRGNDISKTGDESNPAVHIERSGNDVVKLANELNVEKKAEDSATNGDTNSEPKPEEKKDEEVVEQLKDTEKEEEKKEEEPKKDEAQAGDKRKADEKVDPPAEEKKDEEEVDAKKQKTTNGTDTSTANGNKKKPGRPKAAGANGEKKAPKKEKKQPVVGRAERKTRSQAKADGS